MSFDLKIKNGDITIKNGDLEKVTGAEKLVQDVLKIALTNVGSNTLNPWYGSYISRSLIGSSLDNSIVIMVAQSQIENCLDSLKKLQEIQLTTGQSISADEQISSIIGVTVDRNKYDPRMYNVLISILTKGLKKITTQFSISPI